MYKFYNENVLVISLFLTINYLNEQHCFIVKKKNYTECSYTLTFYSEVIMHVYYQYFSNDFGFFDRLIGV